MKASALVLGLALLAPPAAAPPAAAPPAAAPPAAAPPAAAPPAAAPPAAAPPVAAAPAAAAPPAAAPPNTPGLSPDLAAMVQAERDFAKVTAEKGIRDGFLEYFADDSITLEPRPGSARERLLARPRPADPLRRVLSWEPKYGDISSAGDLGWLTGPYVLEERTPSAGAPTAGAPSAGAPARYGQYFSIWRRQPDGHFKVLLDQGIDTPGPTPDSLRPGFTPAPSNPVSRTHPTRATPGQATPGQATPGQATPGQATPGQATPDKPSLLEADRDLARQFAAGVARAYSSALSTTGRLYRPGLMPITGRDAIVAWWKEKPVTLESTPIDGIIARSADLGFTWGGYRQTRDAVLEPGYYARLWKRNEHARWKLVLEVTSPTPPDKAP